MNADIVHNNKAANWQLYYYGAKLKESKRDALKNPIFLLLLHLGR
jgi:hypothetical protein